VESIRGLNFFKVSVMAPLKFMSDTFIELLLG
jgi:hypothetical protein